MENDKEIIDSTNNTETTENNELEIDLDETDDTQEDEKVEVSKKYLDTLKAQKEHFKKKANKVSETKKPEQKPEQTKTQNDYSFKDIIALSKADINDEDMETVQKFAKMEGISISEALKNEDLKAVLDRRASVRKTAEVTNTSTSKRTQPKVTPDALIKNLSEGKVPEPGSKEAEELFWARRKKQ